MFPEITRDEVFRIETPRLWLRWPVLADAGALVEVMAQGCRDVGDRVNVNLDEVEAMIVRWRSEMQAGTALHLVLTPKAGTRRPVGLIHAGRATEANCSLSGDPTLGVEADRALRHMTRILGVRSLVRRGPPMAHQGIPPRSPDNAACCMQA